MTTVKRLTHGGYQPAIPESEKAIDIFGAFDYMFPSLARDNASLLPDDPSTIQHLIDLADAMSEQSDDDQATSSIPPVYTYWGQFIDHDITASDFSTLPADIDTLDFTPLAPDTVINVLPNRRRAQFDLDSLYGDSPDEEAGQIGMYQLDKVKLTIGRVSDIGASLTPDPELGLDRDLPRGGDKGAIIGDGRNDENTIIAQFHLAWLRFHNAVVDWVADNEGKQGSDLYWRSRQLVRFTYQWLTVHDYLQTLCQAGIVDDILANGATHFSATSDDVFMPLEFAGAAYRFGHSMVRATYDFNKNFGRNNGSGGSLAPFSQLFAFTGGGGMFGLPTLPNNWIIEWDRFTDHAATSNERFARKIDTKIAMPLSVMTNEVMIPTDIFRHLSRRNLLRGYLLSIPTGQAIAGALGVEALSAEQLNDGILPSALVDSTPLWYYVLKEAEIQEDGDRLGTVGSRLIAETIIGLMQIDSNSFFNFAGGQGWTPDQGVKLNGQPITTIMDVFRFAGVA